MEQQTVKNDLYYMDHPAEWDALNEDQLSDFHAGNFAPVDEKKVETETKVDAVDAAAATDTSEAAGATDKNDDVDDPAKKKEEPVVQAKDGKNVIPYSELEDSRTATADAVKKAEKWEKLATDNKDALDTFKSDLEAAKKLDEETGKTEEQDKILADFKEDYGDIHDAVMAVVGKEVGGKMAALEGQIKELTGLESKVNDLTEKVAPIEATVKLSADEKHSDAILTAHPDFQAIIDSGKLTEFIDKQPSIIKSGLLEATKSGTTTQVIELLQMFKDAHPDDFKAATETSDTDAEALKAAKEKEEAAKKIEGATADPPTSLSDVSGGTVHHDEAEAMMAMNGEGLMGKFEGKNFEEITALINKVL